jgi:hypothetical protein
MTKAKAKAKPEPEDQKPLAPEPEDRKPLAPEPEPVARRCVGRGGSCSNPPAFPMEDPQLCPSCCLNESPA